VAHSLSEMLRESGIYKCKSLQMGLHLQKLWPRMNGVVFFKQRVHYMACCTWAVESKRVIDRWLLGWGEQVPARTLEVTWLDWPAVISNRRLHAAGCSCDTWLLLATHPVTLSASRIRAPYWSYKCPWKTLQNRTNVKSEQLAQQVTHVVRSPYSQ